MEIAITVALGMANTMNVSTPGPPFDDPCVVHDPMTFRGGGEQYAAELAVALDATLYTYRKTIDLDSDVEVVEFGDGGKLDEALMKLPFRGLAVAIAYENFEVPEHHDVVVTTGGAAKSTIHKPYQHRIHLMHTPQRWLFDRGPGQYEDSRWPIKWIKRGYQSFMRIHDQSTIPHIDDFVVNSEVIARRLETYHRRDPAAVVYPPVDLESYYHEEDGGFLLFLGRLERHKRVGEVVKAVSGTDYTLKVAGTGSMEDELCSLASDNVEFLRFVSEDRKRELLATCDALLFNSEHEDFGIVPIEALASGNPVVGVNEGFTKCQIESGVNGVLFDRGVENMRNAISRMYDQSWDVAEIQATAKRYGLDRFEDEWHNLICEDET